MDSAEHDRSERLREEILAVARREAGAIRQAAQQAAAAVLAKAEGEAARAREARLAAARAAAATARELALAAVPVAVGRLWAEHVEDQLDEIRAEILRRLTPPAGDERRETVVALAAAAVRQLAGERFTLLLSLADAAAFGDGLATAVAGGAGRQPLELQVVGAAAVPDGGVMVRDADGRQEWDNRLPARLQRLWPELRRQIAGHLPGCAAGADATGGGGA
ncbi:MAG: V-type ATP synthase subunit E family protein [Lentisphaeria bacterium]